ncbi:hypothetical protein BGZ65_003871 [Modicella reniformis]|uniref:Uncharacterized protein n=1 Tax=Modicella reniformis TaxID=1440133 RepID=A0A9P6M932_9FUNG|nr:hypothetical protein BGZ65_003871 [Modicella reniformis]
MIALFGTVPEPNHSLEDLIKLWRRPGFIIYFSMIEFAVASLLIGSMVVEYILKRDAKADLMVNSLHHPRHLRSGSLSSVNGYNIQRTSYYTKLISGRLQQGKLTPARIRTMMGIAYGCVSGLLSSQTLLIAKSAIELLLLTFLGGKNQFENPLSWFLVIALISSALLQLYSLNKGLQFCDTVLLVPLSFCAYNVSCLFNGLVYYNQWGLLQWWQILLILIGISQVLIGVLVLAWRPTPGEEFCDDDIESDEATLLLPNTSQSSTLRHNHLYSFKNVSTNSSNGTTELIGHHMRQDSSIDAINLIQGFEMYDSDDDDDDARTSVMDPSPSPSPPPQQRR